MEFTQSDELAERQIRIAKELGFKYAELSSFYWFYQYFKYADELGLLYFEDLVDLGVKAGNDFLNKNPVLRKWCEWSGVTAVILEV